MIKEKFTIRKKHSIRDIFRSMTLKISHNFVCVLQLV